MKIKEMKLADIIPYENNPRRNADAVAAVAASIEEFGWQQPIVVDKENVIVVGHTRYLAAQRLGIDTVPVKVADGLSDEKIRAYRLADNKTAELAAWDEEALELELAEIEDLDMSLFGFDDEYEIEMEDEEHPTLNDQFVVPPFSVLDTRQGYWQERKRYWLQFTGDLSETRDGEFGRLGTGRKSLLDNINSGTSNFDPVLAEISYKWFCRAGGKILDPFAGEQTKGVVAGELGYRYTGCDIRQDQVTVDKEQTRKYKGVQYVCGDSTKIETLIKDRDFDMCFTSPPYYDLEVYSKEDLSSLGSYEEFMRQYCSIFKQCYSMLKDDTFLVIKVGEIRNKKTGEYRSFVPDTIKAMTDIGFTYYNELILVNPVGTGHLRAAHNMRSRKIVKLHQNVLVFYKGDIGQIAKHFPPLSFADIEEE